jgi:hypothetical protein
MLMRRDGAHGGYRRGYYSSSRHFERTSQFRLALASSNRKILDASCLGSGQPESGRDTNQHQDNRGRDL